MSEALEINQVSRLIQCIVLIVLLCSSIADAHFVGSYIEYDRRRRRQASRQCIKSQSSEISVQLLSPSFSPLQTMVILNLPSNVISNEGFRELTEALWINQVRESASVGILSLSPLIDATDAQNIRSCFKQDQWFRDQISD